uniref:Major sperm protein n=1 Tax=Caenorhabditis tropicalis TaxID=1561998 RepID=A0A1I7UFT5_9PELO
MKFYFKNHAIPDNGERIHENVLSEIMRRSKTAEETSLLADSQAMPPSKSRKRAVVVVKNVGTEVPALWIDNSPITVSVKTQYFRLQRGMSRSVMTHFQPDIRYFFRISHDSDTKNTFQTSTDQVVIPVRRDFHSRRGLLLGKKIGLDNTIYRKNDREEVLESESVENRMGMVQYPSSRPYSTLTGNEHAFASQKQTGSKRTVLGRRNPVRPP